jgi:hypothetical protein
MRAAIIVLPIATLLSAQPVSAAVGDPQITAAAHAGGCTLDPDYPFGADLAEAPGQSDPALKIVTTLSGGADARSLGTLCVALVEMKGGNLVRVAGLSGPDIEPPGDVEQVTNVYANVEKTAFRFMPAETAIAVDAAGEYNSEVTNLSWRTLYLFRRVGTRLLPIFHARVEDETIDKSTSDGKQSGEHWIVQFAPTTHAGAYDLILRRYHGIQQHRFRWNGVRYIPDPRGQAHRG